jgi:hypothetical protein
MRPLSSVITGLIALDPIGFISFKMTHVISSSSRVGFVFAAGFLIGFVSAWVVFRRIGFGKWITGTQLSNLLFSLSSQDKARAVRCIIPCVKHNLSSSEVSNILLTASDEDKLKILEILRRKMKRELSDGDIASILFNIPANDRAKASRILSWPREIRIRLPHL